MFMLIFTLPLKRQPNENIRRNLIMAYRITDSCVACGSCEGQCPVSAISMGDGKYEIDAEKCITCGSCASTCPTGAIEEE